MEENRIYKGYWWLPSSPDAKVAGTLNIEPDGDLRLELYGGFGSEKSGLDFEREPDKVIHGRCYAPNGHMKDISLFECHSALNFNFSSSFPITRYTCQYALIGFHAESMKRESFFEAHVSFDELAYWCPPKNITTRFNNTTVTITYDHSEENENLAKIELEDGIKLRLNQGGSYQPDYPKILIEQSTYLEVAKENMSALDVIVAARKFERFLSLAMLASVEHDKITLRSRDCCQTMENGEPYYHPIELVTHLYKGVTPGKVKQYDILFKYENVSNGFAEMYRRFCTDQSIAQIWSNLVDSLEKKRVFTSNDFLVVIQALDGFSIRFRKEQEFLKQLTALRDEFKDIRRVNLTNDDLKCARGSRDYYSHILKIEKKEKKNALEGAKLYELTRKLRILLICCALNFLGMDNAHINDLFSKCNNSILRN